MLPQLMAVVLETNIIGYLIYNGKSEVLMRESIKLYFDLANRVEIA
jgi:hypothetical protein